MIQKNKDRFIFFVFRTKVFVLILVTNLLAEALLDFLELDFTVTRCLLILIVYLSVSYNFCIIRFLDDKIIISNPLNLNLFKSTYFFNYNQVDKVTFDFNGNAPPYFKFEFKVTDDNKKMRMFYLESQRNRKLGQLALFLGYHNIPIDLTNSKGMSEKDVLEFLDIKESRAVQRNQTNSKNEF